MRRARGPFHGLLVLTLLAPAAATAGLVDVFENPAFARLGLAPLGPVLAGTVASTYPVASASSSVVYELGPGLDALERRPGLLGPILGERAETLGPGRIDVGVSYSFVDLATINGEPMNDLVNARSVGGRFLFLPVPDGVTLRDGRVTNFLPVRVALDLGVTAHIVTPSVTYGVGRDLDLNVSLPVLRTALEVRARTRLPDPRHPAFALPPGSPVAGSDLRSDEAASEGVGDLLLRAKYALYRGTPMDVSAGLGLALPSGKAADLQGTGTTRVQPLLIASRTFGRRLELLANAGAELNADDVGRSILRWAVGGTASVVEPVAIAVLFLGRHELGRQSEAIRLPFFFQIERNDFYDASVGVRWRFAEAGVVSGNALLPVNRDGLRADVIPTFQVEYAF